MGIDYRSIQVKLHPIWILMGILSTFTFNQCGRSDCSIEASPVDLKVWEESGNLRIEGPSILQKQNKFIWGASVIQGKDGRYHMFYSTWGCGPDSIPFSASWVLNSTIGYAVSDYPDRNFQPQKIILQGAGNHGDSTAWDAQAVHNPHIQRFGNYYYLYYTGSQDPGPVSSTESKGLVDKRNRVQQSQKIGVIRFAEFDDLLSDNFVRPSEPLLSPRTRVKPDHIIFPSPENVPAKPDNIIVVNPSVVFNPLTAKYHLFFKGNLYDPHWRGVHGVAISDFPDKGFIAKDKFVMDIRLENDQIANSEDPYVWYSPDDKMFYAVVKDFSGKITGTKAGLALLNSTDGFKWLQHANPFFMAKKITLLSGQEIQVSHLERPQLLINEKGIPEVFFAACSIQPAHQKINGGTFNVHIPLKCK